MAEARAKSECERWVGGDREDVGGDGLAGEYECLCGHWPWDLPFSRVASCLECT